MQNNSSRTVPIIAGFTLCLILMCVIFISAFPVFSLQSLQPRTLAHENTDIGQTLLVLLYLDSMIIEFRCKNADKPVRSTEITQA